MRQPSGGVEIALIPHQILEQHSCRSSRNRITCRRRQSDLCGKKREACQPVIVIACHRCRALSNGATETVAGLCAPCRGGRWETASVRPSRHARGSRPGWFYVALVGILPPTCLPRQFAMPYLRRSDPRRGVRGGRFMTSRSAGSAAKARPGRPSVTRLIHRIWMGSSGIGKPRKGARKRVQISPELRGQEDSG